MISRAEIIRWRAHAPWTRDSQIEQDLLLTRAMVLIFGDPFLKEQVAMRGGTVLHKVHLAPARRYSEDIDLVLVGDRPIGHITRALLRVLEPLLGKPVRNLVTQVQLAVRNFVQPSKIQRIEYEFAPTVAPPSQASIKVEINYSENAPFYQIVHLPYAPPLPELDGKTVMLRSYDLDEMLGTKMRALFQRVQGRDLFDLWHAWSLSEAGAPTARVQPERVVAAFSDYMRRENTVVTRAEYDTELASKLRMPMFRNDMAAMIHADVKGYDVDQAAEVVRSVFLSRLT